MRSSSFEWAILKGLKVQSTWTGAGMLLIGAKIPHVCRPSCKLVSFDRIV